MTEKPMPSQKKPLKPSGPKPPLPKYSRGPFSWLLIGLVVMFVLMTLTKMNRVQPLKFSEFETYVEQGYVQNADLNESARKIKGELTDAAVEALNQGDTVVAKVYEVRYAPEMLQKNFTTWLKKNGVGEYDAAGESWVLPLLVNLLSRPSSPIWWPVIWVLKLTKNRIFWKHCPSVNGWKKFMD